MLDKCWSQVNIQPRPATKHHSNIMTTILHQSTMHTFIQLTNFYTANV